VSLSASKTGESNPIVAVRSTGYSFDSIIGYQDQNGRNVPLVDERYLRTLLAIANDRFRINVERIARFQNALMTAFNPPAPLFGASGKPAWEDADTRRQRKREEGLARGRALRTKALKPDDPLMHDPADVNIVDSMFQ
jgi:tRNA wybutosine-synthesizing protein 3